ncbi:hypothetical protein FACS1894176_10360 [Bacteroidia bacterium]|nr:hypothetical protein FACS1894176_10360 [Bacteroidia bacterium]
MNMKSLSKNDLCTQFITPALEKSGWDRELQISFCEDENFVHSELNTDYVLFYKPNVPVAVISVTENNTEIDAGIRQAVSNAERLDVPCAFSSNGEGFLFHNRTKPLAYAETELDLDHFPTPEQLWAIYLDYKTAQTVAEESAKAVKKGQNRILLGIAAIGAGLVAVTFQLIKGILETGTNKRALYLTDRDDYWQNRDWDNWRDRNDWQNRANRNALNQRYADDYKNRITPLSQMPPNQPAGIYWASVPDLSSNGSGASYKQFPSDFFDAIIVDKTHSGTIADTKEWQVPLAYFKSAAQIAVAPRETVRTSDVGYFGKPIYIDTSKQSIVDSNFPTHDISPKESHTNSEATGNIPIANDTIINNSSTNISQTTTNNNVNISNTTINNRVNNHTKINHNKITINNTIMARQVSKTHQLELAESLKSYLHGFQERLGDVAQNYKNKCNQLYEAGMMDEFHKKFEQEYMQETIQKIAAVVEQINDSDIPFIEEYIDLLESIPSA